MTFNNSLSKVLTLVPWTQSSTIAFAGCSSPLDFGHRKGGINSWALSSKWITASIQFIIRHFCWDHLWILHLIQLHSGVLLSESSLGSATLGILWMLFKQFHFIKSGNGLSCLFTSDKWGKMSFLVRKSNWKERDKEMMHLCGQQNDSLSNHCVLSFLAFWFGLVAHTQWFFHSGKRQIHFALWHHYMHNKLATEIVHWSLLIGPGKHQLDLECMFLISNMRVRWRWWHALNALNRATDKTLQINLVRWNTAGLN